MVGSAASTSGSMGSAFFVGGSAGGGVWHEVRPNTTMAPSVRRYIGYPQAVKPPMAAPHAVEIQGFDVIRQLPVEQPTTA